MDKFKFKNRVFQINPYQIAVGFCEVILERHLMILVSVPTKLHVQIREGLVWYVELRMFDSQVTQG